MAGCSRLIFHPTQTWVRTPADVGVTYRDVPLTAADGVQLSAWWLPADGQPRGAILFLHGNAENISTHLASVYWLPAAGYNVLLLDYRGFGASGGSPSLPAVFLDIEAALSWLADEYAEADLPVFMLGQSLGASLGAHVAGSDARWRQLLDGVILDAGFSRYSLVARDVARKSWLLRPFQYPVALTMPDGYDPIDSIGAISPVPLMLIHGRHDQVIDSRYAQQLFAAAGEPKRLLQFDGGHIQTFQFEDNRQHLLDFLDWAAQRRH
jgi:alpha-beta hydrolase superfamily lysophospholipase